MKKIAIFIAMMMLTSMAVFAAPGQGNPFTDQEQKFIKVSDIQKPPGLERAIVQVNNTNAEQKLMRNLERFQQRTNLTCEEDCRINLKDRGEFSEVEVNKPQRVLFFEVNKRSEYIIDNEGTTQAVRRNIWARLFE